MWFSSMYFNNLSVFLKTIKILITMNYMIGNDKIKLSKILEIQI